MLLSMRAFEIYGGRNTRKMGKNSPASEVRSCAMVAMLTTANVIRWRSRLSGPMSDRPSLTQPTNALSVVLFYPRQAERPQRGLDL